MPGIYRWLVASSPIVVLLPSLLLLAPPALGQEGTYPMIHPTALMQPWITVMDQDLDPQADLAGYGDPEDDPGFKIRRARIGLEGEIARELAFRVVLGAASPYDTWDQSSTDIYLVDASMAQKWKGFVLSLGQQKVPYSREQIISSRDLVFNERAVSTEHMVPGRETGLIFGWSGRGISMDLGVFNGSGSFLGDDNIGMLVVGRAEYSTAPEDSYSTYGNLDKVVLAVAANTYYNDDLSTDTLSFGADLMFRVAGFSLLAEGHSLKIEPTSTDISVPDVLYTTSRIGGMFQVGYCLGAVEPALRFSVFDDNLDFDDNGDVWESYAGVTLHLVEDMGRIGAGYIHRGELAGSSVANDTIRIWAQVAY